jgi:hypothetical protein
MNNTSLEQFVSKVAASGQITFVHVCRLRRGILPNGILPRDDAELLLQLDRNVSRADQSWCDWLTTMVTHLSSGANTRLESSIPPRLHGSWTNCRD